MSEPIEHIPDLRSYALHEKASDILKADPARYEEVLSVLEHWIQMEDTQAQGWALKWHQLVANLSVNDIADLIVRKTEEMDFYRKSSPFPCLLSDEQRLNIIRKFKYNYE